ncbi:MAG: hypothetical protein ACKOEO_22830, partial [Planctomycetaceae bacterium]
MRFRTCFFRFTIPASPWDGETVLRTPVVVFRTPPHLPGRAGDVNSPVTVRARAARVAAGAHQRRYRPSDI